MEETNSRGNFFFYQNDVESDLESNRGVCSENLGELFICLLAHIHLQRYYLLIPWSRVLLEKLTASQLVKKFPTLYGTQRRITSFTISRHLSLS
jgi:hypothetical protein